LRIVLFSCTLKKDSGSLNFICLTLHAKVILLHYQKMQQLDHGSHRLGSLWYGHLHTPDRCSTNPQVLKAVVLVVALQAWMKLCFLYNLRINLARDLLFCIMLLQSDRWRLTKVALPEAVVFTGGTSLAPVIFDATKTSCASADLIDQFGKPRPTPITA
jgi:hypothetical protein